MQEITYKVVDGKYRTLCPYAQRDENTEILFNVGSVSCKCDCQHFEGIRKSQNVVYCNFKKDSSTSDDISVPSALEQYIKNNNLEGSVTAIVLREYEEGKMPLGNICRMYKYSYSKAISHHAKAYNQIVYTGTLNKTRAHYPNGEIKVIQFP
jgi:hypothetical protein